MQKAKSAIHQKLGELYATAICSNDILSSCLYVSGIATIFAGIYAPLVLLVVGIVLFFYKAVYTEVVEALPVNGGAYNCLLNGTSKIFAAFAGVLTFLSYIATAVISAKTAVEYLHTVIKVPVVPLVIILLFTFALLVISGIKDSAKVALGIFAFHIVSLVVFIVFGLLYILKGNEFYAQNILQTSEILKNNGGWLKTFYFAFSASLLGISGFESSANFVEEQQKGVFRKTLRNMLLGVAIFNPLIAFVVLGSMSIPQIAQAKDFVLSGAALAIGGRPLQYLIVTDAFLVLSGAVLTSFVGVSGLIYRMASDACLPQFFTKKNSRGSYPRIIITFFILCSSILIITKGNLLSLAGVYTIAFLGVMSAFALGNLILRESRTELKRTYSAPLLFVFLAFLATVFGIIGNIRIDVNNLRFFELYFIPCAIVVLAIIYQDYILRWLVRISAIFPPLYHRLYQRFSDLIEGRFVVFVHHASRLYKVLDYINKNETGWNVTLVHCKSTHGHEGLDNEIKAMLPILQKAGVFPHFKLDFLYIDEHFTPQIVDKLSRKLKIHKNRMFIGSIHDEHEFDYGDLGGVRIIF